MQHRAAPDHRLVARIKKSNRNHFEPVRLNRLNLVIRVGLWLTAGAQHERDVWPVHVGIEQSHLISQLGQRDSQVDGYGGLADAALAGTDGDDRVNAGNRLGRWRLLTGRMCMCAQKDYLSRTDPLIIS